MTMQSTLTRSLQMTLCAAATVCAMGAAHAQQPAAKLTESSSTQTPVQASPSQARNPDGVRDHSSQTTAPSKSSMEARQPAQASPTNARSVDGRKDMPASHSGSTHVQTQSDREAMKPAQASPMTPGSTSR